MECTEDEVALRSEKRTTRRVTRVVAFNASASLSDLYRPDGVMLHKPPSKGSRHRQLQSSDRHYIDYVTNLSVFAVAILAHLRHRSRMSIRRPMNIEPS